MRAVVLKGFGGLEMLEERDLPVPEPGPGEVLVRNLAVAVNPVDAKIRAAGRWAGVEPPFVLGYDAAGVVAKVGPGVKDLKEGDEVYYTPEIFGNPHGTYAEYVVLPEANLAPKPKSLSFEEAAAIPLTFLTAWQMVVDKLGVRPGDDVLVMAAGSGVSVAAIQIAKLFGARVIATAGSEDKLRRAKALGADETVNYTHPDWPKEVRRLTGGKGADKVVDHTGALYFEGVIKATANGGRIAIAGASSGYEGTLPFAHVFYRQLSILGSTMASKSRLFPILRFVEEGKLKPVVGQVLPLEAAAEGHRLLEERRVFGKVVLQMG